MKEIPDHMKTKEWIESSIRHEEHEGVHTYHMCDCGKNSCRSVMCSDCWRKQLEEK
jgi:hypothetical protein